jgi:hypothetical protein
VPTGSLVPAITGGGIVTATTGVLVVLATTDSSVGFAVQEVAAQSANARTGNFQMLTVIGKKLLCFSRSSPFSAF